MVKTEINLKIGGEAGWGIKAAGEMFARVCARGGFCVFYYDEYPSLIQGGHNTCQIRVSQEEIFSQTEKVDLLIALNRETVDLHWPELVSTGAIIFDSTKFNLDGLRLAPETKLVDLPLNKLALDSGGSPIMRNTVALGAVMALLGTDLKLLAGVIKDEFAHKSEEVVLTNQKAAQAGYDFVKEKYGHWFELKSPPGPARKRIFLSGNTAVALGALAAGCRFYVAYPMTPVSSILHYLAAWGPGQGMVVRHAEDEVGVINEAIGAAFAGARAMCATSGGGFALMNEGFSLAGMTETPLVVVMGQRPGPATGLPTWTEQGDLNWVLNAGHGEFPRIVLTPGDVSEAFWLTVEAFNLADLCQTPVVVLTDKHLGESSQSCSPFDWRQVTINRGKWVEPGGQDYKRYLLTEDGVSPRLTPGTPKAIIRANSDEHNEAGYSDESSQNRVKMVNKRLVKFSLAKNQLDESKLQGETDASVTFIGWGSTKGAIRDAVALLARKGVKANYLHLPFVQPFPKEAVAQVLGSVARPILVENNATGQLGKLIRQETGFEFAEKLLKSDGRPFYPEEIAKAVNSNQ